jgi:hypothetical protein
VIIYFGNYLIKACKHISCIILLKIILKIENIEIVNVCLRVNFFMHFSTLASLAGATTEALMPMLSVAWT